MPLMEANTAELLKQHGLQVTAQRIAVLEAVHHSPHSTSEKIANAVREEIGSISKQAVYDALEVLTENGLIRRIRPADSPALYEDRVGDNHHHAICRGCGLAVDVECSVGRAEKTGAAKTSGFKIEQAEVIFWGHCPTCSSELTQNN